MTTGNGDTDDVDPKFTDIMDVLTELDLSHDYQGTDQDTSIIAELNDTRAAILEASHEDQSMKFNHDLVLTILDELILAVIGASELPPTGAIVCDTVDELSDSSFGETTVYNHMQHLADDGLLKQEEIGGATYRAITDTERVVERLKSTSDDLLAMALFFRALASADEVSEKDITNSLFEIVQAQEEVSDHTDDS